MNIPFSLLPTQSIFLSVILGSFYRCWLLLRISSIWENARNPRLRLFGNHYDFSRRVEEEMWTSCVELHVIKNKYRHNKEMSGNAISYIFILSVFWSIRMVLGFSGHYKYLTLKAKENIWSSLTIFVCIRSTIKVDEVVNEKSNWAILIFWVLALASISEGSERERKTNLIISTKTLRNCTEKHSLRLLETSSSKRIMSSITHVFGSYKQLLDLAGGTGSLLFNLDYFLSPMNSSTNSC